MKVGFLIRESMVLHTYRILTTDSAGSLKRMLMRISVGKSNSDVTCAGDSMANEFLRFTKTLETFNIYILTPSHNIKLFFF